MSAQWFDPVIQVIDGHEKDIGFLAEGITSVLLGGKVPLDNDCNPQACNRQTSFPLF